MQSERAASDMLEDALHQFDNIIEGSAGGANDVSDLYINGSMIDDEYQGIGQLMDDLRMTIEAEQISMEQSDRLLSHLSPSTLQFYRDLFKISSASKESESDTIKRLRKENESLSLQVSVLTDQVELQTEKGQDLERTMKELQEKLLATEKSLQQEIISRTRNETESLALHEKISQMKLQLVQQEQLERKTLVRVSSPDGGNSQALKEDVTDGKSSVGSELLSPDEGIVHDHIQDKINMLRMPDPSATSTPISAAVPAHSQEEEPIYDTPRRHAPLKPEVADVDSKPADDFSMQYRSVSLERLQGKRILMNAETQSVSSNQTKIEKNIGVNPAEDVSNNSYNKATSSPNLAVTEVEPREAQVKQNLTPSSNDDERNSPSPFHNRKKHGFKKFFSSFRLRRSSSSNLQYPEGSSQSDWRSKSPSGQAKRTAAPNVSFQRGGVRATAGPRLGWANSKPSEKLANNAPFSQWNVDDICDWLTELGLVAYVPNCKSWVKSGATLLQATNQDLERELGIRNPLHKKKLMLSLQALGEEDEVDGLFMKGGAMDPVWVSRWLDDIGLPQYKDAFHEACIDGRMLHHLTIADLQRLRITNLLHTLSLRRAIYTLRSINFDPTLLNRRPVEDEAEENVLLWTNHRVMEWLRTIDLAEYAPNLRGSGVHGSLMVLEPQFTGEVIASLLHIPNSKSLLRRHLNAKFNELIPAENLKLKQSESTKSVLNVTAKVKVGRRSFGPLSRLRGSGDGHHMREFSSGEYVCPIETKNSGLNRSFGAHRRELEARLCMKESRDKKISENEFDDDRSADSNDIKVVELKEVTTRKIGAFSAEIATLTNKWSEEETN